MGNTAQDYYYSGGKQQGQAATDEQEEGPSPSEAVLSPLEHLSYRQALHFLARSTLYLREVYYLTRMGIPVREQTQLRVSALLTDLGLASPEAILQRRRVEVSDSVQDETSGWAHLKMQPNHEHLYARVGAIAVVGFLVWCGGLIATFVFSDFLVAPTVASIAMLIVACSIWTARLTVGAQGPDGSTKKEFAYLDPST